jgi:hypothetical protein
LSGIDCISLNRVNVKAKFDMGIAGFIDIMEELLEWFVSQVNANLDPSATKFTRKQCFFKNIFEGSVNADTVLSIGSSSSVGAVASGISSALSSGAKVGGVPISGSAEAVVALTKSAK